MLIPIEQNERIYRGQKSVLEFFVTGDYTAATEIYYTAKESKVPTAVRYLDLSLGGGDIAIVKQGAQSKITVTIPAADTQDLLFASLYHEIELILAGVTLAVLKGTLNLDADVRTPYDNQTIPATEYYNQVYDRLGIWKVETDGTVTEIKDQGWNTTVTAVRNSEGMFTISSTEEIFDNITENVLLAFTPQNINSSASVLNSLPVFNHNLGKSKTDLLVGITNLNDGAVQDVEFLIEVKRVR